MRSGGFVSLRGLDDDEYLWEPVGGCWNVRRRGQATSSRPYGGGPWVFDNADEEPSPAPVTTIGWRLMHLVDVIGGYHVFLWGDGHLTDDWFEVPGSAAAGVALWDHTARHSSRRSAARTTARSTVRCASPGGRRNRRVGVSSPTSSSRPPITEPRSGSSATCTRGAPA